MRPAAPTLLELQRAVRASLLANGDSDAARHVRADGLDPAHRLDVYRNTRLSVLSAALRLSYPAVCRLVGPEFFEGAARIFMDRHPPRSAYLNDYGGEFADFLAALDAAASLPYLQDVARLEWAVNRALHAPDAAPLDARRLAELGDADRARACFLPHPSVRLLRLDYPVYALWRAVLEQDDLALACIELSRSSKYLLVQRLERGIEVLHMTEFTWQFATRFLSGMPLHEALKDAPVDAPSLIADHLASGRVAGFLLDDAPMIANRRLI